MNKKYNNVIHIFFSDYFAWLLIVSSLFVVSCVLAIAFGKAQGFIWIIGCYTKNNKKRALVGLAFLRKSHVGCNSPPDCC